MDTLRNRARRARGLRRGFTMVEVAVATGVMVVGVVGMAGAVAASVKLVDANRERIAAHQAARAILEQMQDGDFGDTFAEFNADPSDDPGGAGTGRGSSFDVPGLRVSEWARNHGQGGGAAVGAGAVGGIEFPTLADGRLSESIDDPDLGMPRDLNGDGVISTGALTGGYLVLPVRIRVAWEGPTGPKSITLRTLMVNR